MELKCKIWYGIVVTAAFKPAHNAACHKGFLGPALNCFARFCALDLSLSYTYLNRLVRVNACSKKFKKPNKSLTKMSRPLAINNSC